LLKKVSVLKSSKNESVSQPIIVLADSGAQEFCVLERDYLVSDVEDYDDRHKPNVNLAGLVERYCLFQQKERSTIL